MPLSTKDFIRVSKAENAKAHAARQYKNKTTGEYISRWKYQTLSHGGINPAERAKIRRVAGVRTPALLKSAEYSHLIETYKTKTALKYGIPRSKVLVRGNSPDAVAFRKNVKKLVAYNKKLKKLGIKPHMRSPQQEHELQKILVDLNFRHEDWTMPVGQSPTTQTT